MTALELITECRAAGIDLEARGTRLKCEAAPDALTPALRSKLKRKKKELLSILSAPPSVTLAPTGLTLPLPVVQLAWDLEDRGFCITTGQDGTLSVEPRHALTSHDRAALKRWESHLVALSEFCDQAVAI
jgi:hypothetical protein